MKHRLLIVSLIALVVVSAGCTSRFADSADTPAAAEQPAAVTTVAAAAADAAIAGNATATVTAQSLRVRAAPDATAEVIHGIREGEQYKVIALSSDGAWVELSIPNAPQGRGWVNANFVNVEGPITDAGVVDAPTPSPTPSQSPSQSPTPASVATPANPSTAGTAANAAVEPGAGGIAVVNGEGVRLRVRADASTTADIVGYAYDGERFPVIEISADGGWVRIGGRADTDNPTGGWVAAEFVVIEQ